MQNCRSTSRANSGAAMNQRSTRSILQILNSQFSILDRCGLPGAARPDGRGWHGAGAAGAGGRAVCRLRRAGIGGRHGQGDDEGRLRGRRAAASALAAGSPGRLAGRWRADRSSRSRRSCATRCSSSRPIWAAASASPRPPTAPRWRRGWTRRRATTGGSWSSRASMRARSRSACWATTSRRPACRARLCRRTNGTTTRPSISAAN